MLARNEMEWDTQLAAAYIDSLNVVCLNKRLFSFVFPFIRLSVCIWLLSINNTSHSRDLPLEAADNAAASHSVGGGLGRLTMGQRAKKWVYIHCPDNIKCCYMLSHSMGLGLVGIYSLLALLLLLLSYV